MPPLSILLWLPAACGVLGALGAGLSARGSREPAGGERWSIPGIAALTGSVIALALAIGYIADYESGGHRAPRT